MAKSLFINRVRLPEFSLLEPRPNDQLRLTQNTFSAPIIQYCRETSFLDLGAFRCSKCI